MFFKDYYLGCLAHASYIVGSHGEAVVIDPQRDIEEYVADTKDAGLVIKYVIETHLHADFVSGHRELAERTGAQIVFGNRAKAAFPHVAAKDGDVLTVGALELRILETPGHTPESICIIVTDTEDLKQPAKLFSGDTLFIGDVGRPDLIAAKGFRAEQMAEMMYETLHEKLLKLPDETEIFPAHGAGSLCGKQLSTEKTSTIGLQRKHNYALQPMPKEKFVEMLIADQPEIPQYFSKDVQINWQGAGALAAISAPRALTAEEAEKLSKNDNAIFLDVRSAGDYAAGHIKDSLNIALNGQFASWAGSLIPIGTQIIFVTSDEEEVNEAVTRLARVGIETAIGYLESGIASWTEAGFELTQTPTLTVDELSLLLAGTDAESPLVLDVRRRAEFAAGHVCDAVNIPLAELEKRISEVPAGKSLAIICRTGYRSSTAQSILERAGLTAASNVLGGMTAWSNAGYEVQQAHAIGA